MMKKRTLLWALLSLFLSQNASAFCDMTNTRVNITTNPGNVQYITTKSRSEFLNASQHQVSPNTLGLTVSNLTISGGVVPRFERLDKQICVGIDTLNFKMGYERGNLKVFIDKKYAPGSCEYEVIREHENYHVAVAQQAMLFFKPDIEKKIHTVVGKLRPKVVRSEKEAAKVVQEQFGYVMTELSPLINHINSVIAEKNAKIDTPESYTQTTALCKNW